MKKIIKKTVEDTNIFIILKTIYEIMKYHFIPKDNR